MINRRSPKVFFSSYRPPQKSEKSPGQMRQLVIVALVIVGGYFLTRLPVFQIQHVEVSGDSNELTKRQLNELIGQSLLSAAASNKVREIISGDISILSLNCDKGIPNTLRCTVAFRQPKFVWQTGTNRFYIDEQGYAYAKADKSEKSLKIVEDRKQLPVKTGDLLMSEEVVDIFQELALILKEQGIEIDGYFINTSVLHPGVVASGRSGGKPFPKQKIDIYFSASYPAKNQVEILNKILSKDAGKIKKYIDLRTAGYVYYK